MKEYHVSYMCIYSETVIADSPKEAADMVEQRSDGGVMEERQDLPHRNYKYLSDYWCECGNHLGKKGSVTFCSDCGRKVKWDE